MANYLTKQCLVLFIFPKLIFLHVANSDGYFHYLISDKLFHNIKPMWTELCSHKNSYVEALTLNVTVFGDSVFKR